MFWRDNLVVKLQGESAKEALSLDGASVFEPMKGRPMNGWVKIPFHYKDRWKAFALESSEAVAKLEKKEPKKKAQKKPVKKTSGKS